LESSLTLVNSEVDTAGITKRYTLQNRHG